MVARSAGAAVVRDEVGLPGCGPVAFGSFAFDEHSGSSVMVMPQVVVGHRNGQWWVTTVGVQGALLPAVVTRSGPAVRRPAPLAFADGARSGAEWELVVEEAVSRIADGDLEKVVLARDLVAESPMPVDPRWPSLVWPRTTPDAGRSASTACSAPRRSSWSGSSADS